jgi:hypothetical protein
MVRKLKGLKDNVSSTGVSVNPVLSVGFTMQKITKNMEGCCFPSCTMTKFSDIMGTSLQIMPGYQPIYHYSDLCGN